MSPCSRSSWVYKNPTTFLTGEVVFRYWGGTAYQLSYGYYYKGFGMSRWWWNFRCCLTMLPLVGLQIFLEWPFRCYKSTFCRLWHGPWEEVFLIQLWNWYIMIGILLLEIYFMVNHHCDIIPFYVCVFKTFLWFVYIFQKGKPLLWVLIYFPTGYRFLSGRGIDSFIAKTINYVFPSPLLRDN